MTQLPVFTGSKLPENYETGYPRDCFFVVQNDLEYPIRILKRFHRNEDREDRVKALTAAIRVLEKAHFTND